MTQPTEPTGPGDSTSDRGDENQPPPTETMDLAGGTVPVVDQIAINDDILDARQRRELRKPAFYTLGGAALVYLAALLIVLSCLLSSQTSIAVISRATDWHFLLIVGVALVIFAAVPLSLALAAVRMISPPSNDKQELGITTPQIELLKAFVEAAKALKP